MKPRLRQENWMSTEFCPTDRGTLTAETPLHQEDTIASLTHSAMDE
jgi:hypothetical protein